MADEFQERTERATPRRKQKAREKGQVAKGQDLNSMAAMGGIVMLLYFGGGYFFSGLSDMTIDFLSLEYGRHPLFVLRTASLQTAQIIIPFFAATVILGSLTSVLQTGFVVKPLALDIDRINPVNGIKRIFSVRGLMEFLKSLLKFAIGVGVLYYIIKKNLKVLPLLSAMEMSELINVSGRLLINALVTAFFCFLSVSFVSYALEKWQYERSLRMSRSEVKEEHKETEGDPLIRARIKSLQREAAARRMMQEVPKATVVITNPLHIAVALTYEDRKMPAPKVVAKGAGFVAEKIKEIARSHGVSIVEDKPLARALFKIELNTFIPEELYVAVAKILAYIYKLKGAL